MSANTNMLLLQLTQFQSRICTKVQTFCSSRCSEQSSDWPCPWPRPGCTVHTNKPVYDSETEI